MSTHKPASLADILRWRATNQPDRLAYRLLADGEFEETVLTYAALDRRARSIAAMLQSYANKGDRALLLLPAGFDFIAGYFGCLYAGFIAIPAYPPHPARPDKTLPVIAGIIADASPAIVLLTASLFESLHAREGMPAGFGNTRLLVTDTNETDDYLEYWQQPLIKSTDLAMLQYTSGSTTAPRGVMVNHGNLLHNLELIEQRFGQSSDSHAVIWLPPYHDMGLVGGILQPLYTGYPATLIPHMLFLQQPYRWLQAISRFRATTSGGPNFAYDLCVKKIRPEQRAQLDLSSWTVAFNGAEQVYHQTLHQFAAYFAPCGFRRKAFLPCYGLAEATLLVTGGPASRLPAMLHVSGAALEQHHVLIAANGDDDTRTLVGCGQDMKDQAIRIVDPHTHTVCNPGQVGEIWVKGPCVAAGYWNKPNATEHTFEARLVNSGEGPFLRTGDLGFMHENELFITGRLKNLVICDGNNHYPHDIERTVEACHTAIRPAGVAAFSISKADGERLVIIAEVERRPGVQAQEITQAIRKAVALHHELRADDIRLAKPGSIPKTTSGKIQHYTCKKNYLNGALNQIEST